MILKKIYFTQPLQREGLAESMAPTVRRSLLGSAEVEKSPGGGQSEADGSDPPHWPRLLDHHAGFHAHGAVAGDVKLGAAKYFPV